MPEHYHQMVFCDFDGTITVNETLRAVLEHFIPDKARQVLAQLDAGTMTLRQGVIELIESLPSALEDDIIAFTASQPIRAGFGELLDFLHRGGIPFVVVSSGLGFYIERMLAPWRDRIHAVHALEVDTCGPHMRLHLDHNHPREAMPKEWVLRRYAADERIAIGDSLSDFEMVKAADRVFARDRLLERLRDTGAAVIPYNDFFDVIQALQGARGHGIGTNP